MGAGNNDKTADRKRGSLTKLPGAANNTLKASENNRI
jgi:hypothetical protein